MSPAVPELTAHLGYWLRHVSNHVSHAFARKLAARDVTVAEFALLRMLYGKAPTPPSTIAAQMGLTRGAVSKLADRLAGKNLLIRKASPDDGRAQTLCLTAKGVEFLPELAALADRNEAECFAHLSDHERQYLERILKDTVARLGLTSMPID